MESTVAALAADLRSRSDDDLAHLARSRPDLVLPVPADLGQLAARAAARPSVQRAMELLTRFEHQVVDALVLLPSEVTDDQVSDLLGATGDVRDQVSEVLRRLHALALVAVDPAHAPPAAPRSRRARAPQRRWTLLTAVREIVTSPAGLGPPWATALRWTAPGRLAEIIEDLGLPPGPATLRLERFAADPDAINAVLGDAPAGVLAVVDQMLWGPPAGRVAHAMVHTRAAAATTPLHWLLARGLVVAVDDTTVILPREVSLARRGGQLHRTLEPAPPDTAGRRHELGTVDRLAAAQASALVDAVAEIVTVIGDEAPTSLRNGGLGVRELRRVATAADRPEPQTALLLHIAHACDLIGPSDDDDPRWLPTVAADTWREQDPAAQWVRLAVGWLDDRYVPGLVGRRTDTGGRDRPMAALSDDVVRPRAPAVRREALGVLADLPPGTAPLDGAVAAALEWHTPWAGGAARADLVAWTLAEAETLGVTGRGALATAARHLLRGDVDAATAAVAPLLPEPVDAVILQPDLTAVAPGPPTRALATGLRLMADVESTGGATVFRITETTVRRAFDASWSAAQVHAFLARHAATTVPQPLTYLVDDVARRHGRLRTGACSAYLRGDDEATMSALVADRRLASLGLRLLAPTVAIATAGPDALLTALRRTGHAPVAEGIDGVAVTGGSAPARAPVPHRPTGDVRRGITEESATLAVRALRAGDRAAQVRYAPMSGLPDVSRIRSMSAVVLAVLTEAAFDRGSVLIHYVNTEGQASVRVIEPLRVAGGMVEAFDHRHQEVRTFALHRITGVQRLDDADTP